MLHDAWLPVFTLYYISNDKHEKNLMTKFAYIYIYTCIRSCQNEGHCSLLTFTVIHCLRNMQTIKMSKYRQRITQYLSLFLKVFISLFFISNVFHVTLSSPFNDNNMHDVSLFVLNKKT